LILTKALRIRFRALWFIASAITLIWFLFWILYDIVVWNKALTQARPENYFGLIASIILLVLGIQFAKSSIFEKRIGPLDQKLEKKPAKKTQIQQLKAGQQKQPAKQVHKIKPAKEKKTQMTQGSKVPPGCKFYLGYLHKRSELVEIPEECLECGNVVNCISPTVRNTKESKHTKF
jgi:hypothetical protein